MDLTQRKLTKEEWEALEIPLPKSELKILKMIYNSYEDIDYVWNNSISLNTYMKISESFELYDFHFYELYFKKIVNKIKKNNNLRINLETKKPKKKLKKADIFRIKNLQKKIHEVNSNIYEYILLDMCKNLLSTKKSERIKWYYTLIHLLDNKIDNINTIIKKFINLLLSTYENEFENDKFELILKANQYIEKNKYLTQYSNIELYKHQKDLFHITKRKKPFCIAYQAPTGTGKTLSPIGLSKRYKIIFVCVAKHIGLQLAKACISMEIPIAMALGCNDVSDIRLHYFAAKEIVKNRRSGGIFRVDNSVGDKVDIIISDIQSYLYSMRYMQAFNKTEDILWYWDEPTITLDYENHEFHEILKNNWKKNEIPNIILSSATLPDKEKIMPMIYNYQSKFTDSEIYEIKSYDCKKTISLIDSNGFVIMPHLLANNNKKKLKKFSKYIDANKTLLRHVDVKEMTRFICFLNEKKLIKSIYKIENYFESLKDINIISIKLYYLKLIKSLKEIPIALWQEYIVETETEYKSTIKITTNDSYTLTDGPTIFLTENVERLALFYLRASNIPNRELNDILKIMEENEIYRVELDKITMEEKERVDKLDAIKSDKVDKYDSVNYQKMEEFDAKATMLKSKIKTINLKQMYIPNSKKHLKKFSEDIIKNTVEKNRIDRAFTSEVDDEVVEKIMLLNVKDEFKILLLMGIGVFMDHKCKEYSDIMKKLAQEQKLYLILASSDYIYGTNYQFCHGYLGKDLQNMTQEKMLQAFGRVGRQNNQLEYTLRIRDSSMIQKLYSEEEEKMEIYNMNTLFG